jgi:hypothetical protein
MDKDPFQTTNSSNLANIWDNEEDDDSNSYLNDYFGLSLLDRLNIDNSKSSLIFGLLPGNIDSKENILPNKNNMFKTEKIERPKKKRGPKQRNKFKKKLHSAFDEDNIISKIQTHFFNFIISFINDCIQVIIPKIGNKTSLKKINRNIKAKANLKHLKIIKRSTIKSLLENNEISVKYKKFNKNINKVYILELIKNPWFEKIFNMKFLNLFYYYYNNCQPLHELCLFDKTIELSEKTKSFYDLLEYKRNEKIKKNIITITKMFYINDINPIELVEKNN